MKRLCAWLVLPLALVLSPGCGNGGGGGDKDAGVDAGPDGGSDAGADIAPPEVIEDLPVSEQVQLAGLSGEVNVVRDDRGIPHIYAATVPDALRVQGYLMARDRLAQMIFMKRNFEGRLSELLGNLDPGLVESDKSMRVIGLYRQAQAIYETLADDDPIKLGIDAFSEGVSVYIDEIRSGQARFPGVVSSLLQPDRLENWSSVDTLTLARVQTWDLSDTGDSDRKYTALARAIGESFPADSPDPRLAARADMLHDIWHYRPGAEAVTRTGFAGPPPGGIRPRPRPVVRPDQRIERLLTPPQLEGLDRFYRSLERFGLLDHGPDSGSNNWVVHGSKTETGNPLLANDPHLALPSPPVWWYVHLNTARAGGDYDAMGVAFAGMPLVVLGFNRNVAWGATVSNYDVADLYLETITPGQNGEPDTVLFNGEQVDIEIIHEEIGMNVGDPLEFDIEVVPHHGPILPATRTETSAVSLRWTGQTPSNEFKAFYGFNLAENLDDVKASLVHFEVGGQNFVFATADGDIFWSTRVHVPVRDPRAMTYDPATGTGFSPGMILPGTGEYEWIGRLDDADIPTDENPAKGWIATANQDQVGVSHDGNPFNDEIYLGNTYNPGYRMAAIVERMTDLAAGGAITPEDMMSVQAESRSTLGQRLAGSFVAALDRAEEEMDTAGTHPDLTAVVDEAGPDTMAKVLTMRDRLAAWTSFATPAAVEGDPGAQEIADSVATTIYNVMQTRLVQLAIGDEVAVLGVRPGGDHAIRTIQFALLEPATLATWDDTLGETVLWDDLTTDDVQESRDERIVRAALTALEHLENRLGPDMDGWRWGHLHTVRFKTLVPVDALFGPSADIFSIPPLDSPDFPDGFPRHGDYEVPDASHYDLWSGFDFSFDHGPSQRLVVEMTPDGPRAFNALPGGQVHDPASPHHADEATFWRHNQAPPLAYEEDQVVSRAEERLVFQP